LGLRDLRVTPIGSRLSRKAGLGKWKMKNNGKFEWW
jgi:hypothetical protein